MTQDIIVTLRGVKFAVEVRFSAENPDYWDYVAARPFEDDADFLDFIQADKKLDAELDRQASRQMADVFGTTYGEVV